MWNSTVELARIRRQELLAEAHQERLARIARAETNEDASAPRTPAGRRAATEAPLR